MTLEFRQCLFARGYRGDAVALEFEVIRKHRAHLWLVFYHEHMSRVVRGRIEVTSALGAGSTVPPRSAANVLEPLSTIVDRWNCQGWRRVERHLAHFRHQIEAPRTQFGMIDRGQRVEHAAVERSVQFRGDVASRLLADRRRITCVCA